jgi:ribosomal protein S18 acetylase RimI-like enzyme
MDESICEMKRLFVPPESRGKGYGRLLASELVRQARQIGYKSMRLDTVDWMKEAISLYRSLGFEEIEAYRYNPIEGAVYMELHLDQPTP